VIWHQAQDIPDGTTFKQANGTHQWIRDSPGWYIRNNDGDLRIGWHDNTVTDPRETWGSGNVDDHAPFTEVKV